MKRSHAFLIICLVTLALLVSYSLVAAGPAASPPSADPQSGDPTPVPPVSNDRGVPEVSPSEPNSNERPPDPPSAAELEAAMKATNPGPGYLVLPPAAFSSDGYDPDGFFMYFAGGYFEGTVPSGACVLAPINLPAGSKITGLQVRLQDSNATYTEWFDLYRINLATGAAQFMATVESPTGTTGLTWLTTTTILYPDVSEAYGYQLCTCTRENIYVYSARIGYGFTTRVPLIMKNY